MHVVVVCPKSPSEHVLTELDHQFGEVTHERGSKVITIAEHVSVSDEANAIAFVRGLVLDAVPEGSKITEISATAG